MHKRLAIFVVAAVLLLPGVTTSAGQGSQPRVAAARKGASAITPDPGDLSLQRERLEFDKQKLASDTDIENKKLKIEREKLETKDSILSHLAPWITALAALGAFVFSVWSFGKQAQLQFEIKAAEIAFSRETANAVKSRAKALKLIFPRRLPKDFTSDFDPADFGSNKEPSDEKKFFLELLLKYPGKEAEAFELWANLFPGDKEWLDRVETLCKSPQQAEQAQGTPSTVPPVPATGTQTPKPQI
jgi:hypothetical protein